MIRTTETDVTFRHAFTLPELDRPQPAGTYRVLCDEEEIPGLSFVAFRRVATLLRLPAMAASGGRQEMIPVDARALSDAIAADGAGR
jgi:hypothetical protein